VDDSKRLVPADDTTVIVVLERVRSHQDDGASVFLRLVVVSRTDVGASETNLVENQRARGLAAQ
jgi:hypothetical protein